jgi:hypothetical protein
MAPPIARDWLETVREAAALLRWWADDASDERLVLKKIAQSLACAEELEAMDAYLTPVDGLIVATLTRCACGHQGQQHAYVDGVFIGHPCTVPSCPCVSFRPTKGAADARPGQ